MVEPPWRSERPRTTMRRAAAGARSAGELVGDVGGRSFRRFGFVQSAIVSRWSEIVGERYARVSSPESIRFPTGRKAGGVADPAGRRRPRAADPASRAADHRAGQSLLRLCGGRPGRVQAGQAAAPRPQDRAAGTAAGAQGTRRRPARDRRPRTSCLPGVACGANCRYQRPAVARRCRRRSPFPKSIGASEPMKAIHFLACAAAVIALAGCNKNKARARERATHRKDHPGAPPPGGDWTDVVNATAASFMMGNPNAKVKLVEIGSLTCPHCRASCRGAAASTCPWWRRRGWAPGCWTST